MLAIPFKLESLKINNERFLKLGLLTVIIVKALGEILIIIIMFIQSF